MDNFQTPRRCFETWQYKYVSGFDLFLFVRHFRYKFPPPLSFLRSFFKERTID